MIKYRQTYIALVGSILSSGATAAAADCGREVRVLFQLKQEMEQVPSNDRRSKRELTQEFLEQQERVQQCAKEEQANAPSDPFWDSQRAHTRYQIK